ncbi:RING finger domain-containing protein [Candidatus Protochlamydia phocaeensis]|uniref:RING finger domain-containing protein n=1 Tax=Candidatus Protochlamydia phocaeensis TaxID=1414722 RepID=UPI000838A537|nr:RING finger domain-containing protein [Candidatus Protochlamydia phocaeensis]
MSNLDCSICIQSLPAYPQIADYQADKTVKVLICTHIFHRSCIKEWFDAQAYKNQLPTCPNCRQVIVKKNQNQGCPSLDEMISHVCESILGCMRIPVLFNCFSSNQLPSPSLGSAIQGFSLSTRHHSFSVEPDYGNAYGDGMRMRV